MALMLLAPTALAAHSGPITEQRTYETALHNSTVVALSWTCPTGFVTGTVAEATGVGEADCDPTGTTQDGSIDLGGFAIGVADDEEFSDITSVDATVVDDIWGPGVVRFSVGEDIDDNNIVGEEDKGEASASGCGEASFEPHSDQWVAVAGFVWGTVAQALGCDITESTGGTSGGVLDPAGGVFVVFA